MVLAIEPIAGLKTFTVPGVQGHDVIYGLARGAGPEIFLSVSNEFTPGICANIYSFDPRKETFSKVIDFERETGYVPSTGKIPHSKVHLSLQASPNGRVFAATHFTAPAPGLRDFEPLQCYRGAFEGSYLVEYNSETKRIVNYGCLLPGEGCRISALDARHEAFYLLSYPKNHLYQFQYSRGKLQDLGRMGQENSFGLEIDDAGNVFTTDDLGRFLKYSYIDGVLEELDCYVPLKPGRRRQGNYARRMTKGLDGRFYGAGNKGTHLFQFCPREEQIRDFGLILGKEANTNHDYPQIPPLKAIAQTDVRSLLLVYGGDGAYVDEHQIPSLVRYDLISGETTDLGRFIDQDGVPGWIPQCALYYPEENSLYIGLQHAVGELRLWRVSLPACTEKEVRQSPIVVSGFHEQKVNATPFGASVQGTNALPYATAGNISMLELGWFGEGKVIRAGESAISDLCFIGDVLYGITRGNRSHLIRYAPYAYNRFVENYDVHVCDLGTIADFGTSGARILRRPNTNQLFLFLRTEKLILVSLYDAAAERTAYRPHFHSLPQWDPFSFAVSPWISCSSWALFDLSLTDLVCAQNKDHVWSVNGGGELVSVEIMKQAVSPAGIRVLPNTCLSVGHDMLFVVTDQGEAVRLDISERAAIRSSFSYGEKPEVTCSVYSEEGSLVVLGTADGRLLIHDPLKGTWKEATIAAKVRALTAGRNNFVYGFCGEDNGIGEAFALNLTSCQVRRLGVLQVRSEPRFWINHRCDCAATGKNGEVYFGEADRISHLLVYCPPSNFENA